MELFVQSLEVLFNASAIGLACLFVGWYRGTVNTLGPLTRKTVWSTVFVVFVVLVMLVPATPVDDPSLRIDLRSAIILLAILFGGVVPGCATAAAAALMRLAFGGEHALVGIVNVGSAFVIGLVLVFFLARSAEQLSARRLLLLGLGVGFLTPLPPLIGVDLLVIVHHVLGYLIIEASGVAAGIVIFSLVVLKAQAARQYRDMLALRERELLEKNRALHELTNRLSRTHSAMQSVMDHTVDGLIPLDGEGRILSFSRPAEGIFGYKAAEVVEQSIARLMPVSEAELVALLDAGDAPLDEGATRSREVVGRHKDGSEFPMDLVIGRVRGVERARFVATVRNISERKLTEAQLMQARKMEAVGHLARGLAHDFNNILAAIMGFANLLNEDLPEGTPQSTFARRILAASQRATGLVQQIMTFSRTVEVERQASDLCDVVKEVARVFRTTLPEDVHFEMHFDDHEHKAFINQAQTIQLVTNLCLNARDAIGPAGGEIVVSLRPAAPDDPLMARIRDLLQADQSRLVLRPGYAVWGRPDPALSYFRLSVRDTGPGIPDELMESMFDPFFTTKQRGRGTGLGLAFVLGAVREQNGMGIVESSPGKGATFTIFLPEADAAARLAAGDALPGRERVMIVDDETDITDALNLSLSKLGYDVLAVNTAQDAIAVLEADPAAWDIVASDLTMPGLNGMDLFRKLRALKSPARFILCSGYFDGEVEKEASAAGVDALIEKPVSAVALTGVIRQLMDRSGAA
jgi:PAS domain S-box-containing protein